MSSQKDIADNQPSRNPKDYSLEKVPVIPVSKIVLFQGLNLPIGISEPELEPLCKEAYKEHKLMAVFTLKDNQSNGRFRSNFYEYGTLVEVAQYMEDPKDGPGIIAHVLHVVKIRRSRFVDGVMYFSLEIVEDDLPNGHIKSHFSELFKETKDTYIKMLSHLDNNCDAIVKMMDSIGNPLTEISFMCLNSPLSTDDKIKLLKLNSPGNRAATLMMLLNDNMHMFRMKKEIHDKTAQTIGEQQREHFLRTQIQTIKEELGDTDEDDIEMLTQRAENKRWNREVDAHFFHELNKMERFNPTTPEYGILYSYLETMLDLPWNEMYPEKVSLNKIEKKLNTDHFGLKDVKERILEHMAVLKQRKDTKSPILCLYGPPGVGKTSLGKSIADALGRGYSRVSFGGVHDEAEIRGHRKTYIGAMPGRIIAAMRRMDGSNPVIVLDEIDKIEHDYKGDPSSALLELLDPEQNNKFHDNYLDIDYDMSRVLFIATANDISSISGPLLDRLELIPISGYSQEEKIEIAKRHLVKKSLLENGFKEDEISFTDEALKKIIDNYTKESGVRALEKRIGKTLRKIALLKARKKEYPTLIEADVVRNLLGIEDTVSDIYEGNDLAGVVTGLAWTSVGGEILYVETSLSRSKNPQLTLTGNLGNVMKESATLALQYLKANAESLNLSDEIFSAYNVHIHVPEGAVPKDGPSAGITIATSIASSFTRKKVKPNIAMTGEITLRGKVLPVGGIKEKILAAKRAGIKEIVLSEKNRRDIEEIEKNYIEGLSFTYVNTVSEVLSHSLTDEMDTTLPERTLPDKEEKN